MQSVSRFRFFVGLRLVVLLLALMLVGSNVFAQRAGHWTGRTSQDRDMDFTVSASGTITAYGTGLRQECPSGARPEYGFGRGALIPIVDGSFATDFQMRDDDSGYQEFTGAFTSDTMAEGSFYFLEPRFYIAGGQVDCQFCEVTFTWTATWQASAGAEADNRCTSANGSRVYYEVLPDASSSKR